jgi:hypothetical protein
MNTGIRNRDHTTGWFQCVNIFSHRMYLLCTVVVGGGGGGGVGGRGSSSSSSNIPLLLFRELVLLIRTQRVLSKATFRQVYNIF